MTQTQLQQIRSQLLRNGEVSRNWALRNYISRLASRINDLKNEGMEFEKPEKRNGDYVYKLKINKGQGELLWLN